MHVTEVNYPIEKGQEVKRSDWKDDDGNFHRQYVGNFPALIGTPCQPEIDGINKSTVEFRVNPFGELVIRRIDEFQDGRKNPVLKFLLNQEEAEIFARWLNEKISLRKPYPEKAA